MASVFQALPFICDTAQPEKMDMHGKVATAAAGRDEGVEAKLVDRDSVIKFMLLEVYQYNCDGKRDV